MSQTPSSPPPNFAEPRKKKRSPDSLEALLADLPVLDAPADLVPKSENGATFGRGAAALAGVAGLGFLGLTAVFSYRRSLQRHLKDEAEKRAGGSGTAARPAAAGSARNAAAGAINLKAAPPAPIDPKVLAMAHTVARRALMYSFLISGGMFVVGVGVIAWSMDVQSVSRSCKQAVTPASRLHDSSASRLIPPHDCAHAWLPRGSIPSALASHPPLPPILQLGDVKARAAAALRPIRDGVGGGVAPAVRRIAEKPVSYYAAALHRSSSVAVRATPLLLEK